MQLLTVFFQQLPMCLVLLANDTFNNIIIIHVNMQSTHNQQAQTLRIDIIYEYIHSEKSFI